MTTLNFYDGDFWFVYDDAEGFGPLQIWFTADENINGELKAIHDFQAYEGPHQITDCLSETDRASIIALIDQLFAEYQQGTNL